MHEKYLFFQWLKQGSYQVCKSITFEYSSSAMKLQTRKSNISKQYDQQKMQKEFFLTSIITANITY